MGLGGGQELDRLQTRGSRAGHIQIGGWAGECRPEPVARRELMDAFGKRIHQDGIHAAIPAFVFLGGSCRLDRPNDLMVEHRIDLPANLDRRSTF